MINVSEIAARMSEEATNVWEEKVEIPQDAIVKLSAWDNYTEETVYVCQHEGCLVAAYVEDGKITEVAIMRQQNTILKREHVNIYFLCVLFLFNNLLIN